MMATISAMGRMERAASAPPAPPSRITNPANPARMVWPASMLAKRRTERLIGRVRKEITSIGISRISRYQGACGTNSLKKLKPCLAKPVTITTAMTRQASENVTAIWLVTVKLPGTIPKKLQNSTKMNSEKTKGKNLRPSWPVAEWIMLATNSYEISAIDWVLLGTSRPGLTARLRNRLAAMTTITI